MKNPMVSIIMPVYNGEKYLGDAINSILNQTLTDFELIIINDGSTDESINIIDSFKDNRIKLINNDTNLKLVKTLNKGLDIARGTYIARMDCDDISLPTRLQRQVEFLENNQDYGLCCTNKYYLLDDELIKEPVYKNTIAPVEWTLIWENQIAHPSIMVRKSLVDQYQLRYNDCYSEDYDLWCRLSLITKIKLIDEILLHYRVYSTSTFHSNKEKHLLQAIESSKFLAQQITGITPPDFHQELTSFRGGILTEREYVDLSFLINWSYMVLKRSKIFWKWDNVQYKHALIDLEKRLINYSNLFPNKFFYNYSQILKFDNNIIFNSLFYAHSLFFFKNILLVSYGYLLENYPLTRLTLQPLVKKIKQIKQFIRR